MSSNNTIDDLRSILFDTMRGLKAGTIEIEKAKAISDTAQVIVNTAKTEIAYLQATGGGSSRFLGAATSEDKPPAGDTVEQLKGGRRITHKLEG